MARFFTRGSSRIWLHQPEGVRGPFLVAQEEVRHQQEDILFGHGSQVFSVPGHVSAELVLTLIPDSPEAMSLTNREEDMSRNSSTKEQVEVRTQMAGLIKEAVEAKFGRVKTWVETESVGPLGGVSAKVLGAVEHEGVVVPFAINVYSDDRIVDALEDQLEADAENGKLRDRLGWSEA